MPQFAMAAFAAISSAFSAAGPAAAAAGSTAAAAGAPLQLAGAAASSAAGASMFSLGNIASLAQGGLGLISSMAAVREGQARSMALQMQAADARDNADNERVQALFRQDSLKRQLLQVVGESDVAYAASGVDVTFGSPARARQEATDDAYRALSRDQTTTNMRASRYMRQARALDDAASGAASAGSLKGLGVLGQTALSMVRRG